MSENESSLAITWLSVLIPFIVLSIFFFSMAMYIQDTDIIIIITGLIAISVVVMLIITIVFGVRDETKKIDRGELYSWLLVAYFIIYISMLFGLTMYVLIINHNISTLIILIVAIIVFLFLAFESKTRDIISKRKKKNKKLKQN